jgi:hypothetical protein
MARVRQGMQPSVVVGQQQHTCGVAVEPPHWQQTRPFGPWHEIDYRSTA